MSVYIDIMQISDRKGLLLYDEGVRPALKIVGVRFRTYRRSLMRFDNLQEAGVGYVLPARARRTSIRR